NLRFSGKVCRQIFASHQMWMSSSETVSILGGESVGQQFIRHAFEGPVGEGSGDQSSPLSAIDSMEQTGQHSVVSPIAGGALPIVDARVLLHDTSWDKTAG